MKNYLKKPEAKEKLDFDKLVRIAENVSNHISNSYSSWDPFQVNQTII